jgi:predicted N-acetyltransferase YhbS
VVSRAAAAPVLELAKADVPAIAALLGRAYRDNPLSVALLGDDPGVRAIAVERIHGIRVEALTASPLGLRSNGEVVGVCAFDPPGAPGMPPHLQARMLTVLSEAGDGVLARAGQMLADFSGRAPKEPHWRLGPVAVTPALQGSGLGTRMVSRFCAHVDTAGGTSYLETDREENVRLYERFGFQVIDQAPVLGVPMWFMTRPAGG